MLWMPAIYRVRNVQSSFHDLKEIVVAAESRTGKKWSEEELLHSFIHVTRLGIRNFDKGEGLISSLKACDEDNGVGIFSSDDERYWLELFIFLRPRVLVPAGWGIKVLKLIELGVLKVELRHRNGVVDEIGVKKDGTTVPVRGVE